MVVLSPIFQYFRQQHARHFGRVICQFLCERDYVNGKMHGRVKLHLTNHVTADYCFGRKHGKLIHTVQNFREVICYKNTLQHGINIIKQHSQIIQIKFYFYGVEFMKISRVFTDDPKRYFDLIKSSSRALLRVAAPPVSKHSRHTQPACMKHE